MIMPGRQVFGSGYRYGFNGKENDNEVKGVEGSQQDYGMRIYDPRIGRFLSVDPITSYYPWYTPYQFAGNKPISHVDLDGFEEAPWAERAIAWNTANQLGKTDVQKQEIYRNMRGLPSPETAKKQVEGLNSFFKGITNIFKGLGQSPNGPGSASDDKGYSASEQINQTLDRLQHGSTNERLEVAGELFPSAIIGLGLKSKYSSVKAQAPESFQSAVLRDLTQRSEVFSKGGVIRILEGSGQISVSASGRLKGQITLNGKTAYLEGVVKIEKGALNLKEVGIRDEFGYNSTTLQNDFGSVPFIRLIEELRELRKAGGYKEGSFEYFRLRPEGSKLKDSGTRKISL
jgi:RHS repeat-associated protein